MVRATDWRTLGQTHRLVVVENRHARTDRRAHSNERHSRAHSKQQQWQAGARRAPQWRAGISRGAARSHSPPTSAITRSRRTRCVSVRPSVCLCASGGRAPSPNSPRPSVCLSDSMCCKLQVATLAKLLLSFTAAAGAIRVRHGRRRHCSMSVRVNHSRH